MQYALYIAIALSMLLIFYAYHDSTDISMDNAIEKNLKKNKEWPYLIIGVLDIAHTGDYDDDSEYPSMAMGQIDTGNKVDDISIEINGAILKEAEIDIDSGEKLKIWLNGSPRHEYDIDIYKVVKLEKL